MLLINTCEGDGTGEVAGDVDRAALVAASVEVGVLRENSGKTWLIRSIELSGDGINLSELGDVFEPSRLYSGRITAFSGWP